MDAYEPHIVAFCCTYCAYTAGDLAGATSLLGRPYSVVGRVATRTASAMKFTAPMPVALPPAGRYGAWISQNGAIEGLPGTVDIDSAGEMQNTELLYA